MVICIIALVVLGFLSIFSAGYRPLAKEAFQCVFRLVTLRPCVTKLDERIRAKLTAKLIKIPKLARFVYKNFTALSLIFTVTFFASLGYSIYGLYNLIVLGTCDPYSNTCPLSTKAPVCGCENICQCEQQTCQSPDYTSCEGNCTCQKEICGIE